MRTLTAKVATEVDAAVTSWRVLLIFLIVRQKTFYFGNKCPFRQKEAFVMRILRMEYWISILRHEKMEGFFLLLFDRQKS